MTMMTVHRSPPEIEPARAGHYPSAGGVARGLAMRLGGSRLEAMNAPVDIDLIKGRQRAEDMRRLQAGEVTPEQLQRESAIVQSAADILHVDFSPKGTPEQWARIIQNLQENSESI
jgi:hypothetical protein